MLANAGILQGANIKGVNMQGAHGTFQAIRLAPDDAECHLMLGRISAEMGEPPAKLLPHFKRAAAALEVEVPRSKSLKTCNLAEKEAIEVHLQVHLALWQCVKNGCTDYHDILGGVQLFQPPPTETSDVVEDPLARVMNGIQDGLQRVRKIADFCHPACLCLAEMYVLLRLLGWPSGS